jgi:hypothetical protein
MRRSHPPACRFNLFQEVMALWEEAHPYNAAHLVRLRGRADVPRLQWAVQTACEAAGVGNLVLDRQGRRYHFEPAERIALQPVCGGGPLAERLHAVITEQMNMAFPDEPNHPVRWMVLEDPGSDSHFLIAVWRHLPADDYGIRLLIRRVLNRYFGRLQPGDDAPLTVRPPDYAGVMRHHFRRLGYLRALLLEARRHHALRSVHRMPGPAGGDNRSRFALFQAPEGLIRRLSSACRARHVTVNDAFLGALGAALSELTPHRFHHPRRHALALGSVVNVRAEASQDLSNAFGLFLGHWMTIIDPATPATIGDLVTRIAAQTRRDKDEKRAVGPQWNLWMVARVARWLWSPSSSAWYRKVYPLSAGLSNVKLTASWFRGAREHLLDYIRVSPAGPALPLVLATTGLGDQLNLCLAYHPSPLPDPEADRLMELFLRNLDTLASGGNPMSGNAW